MGIALSVSWDDSKGRRMLASVVLAMVAIATMGSGPAGHAQATASVIVRGVSGSVAAATDAVQRAGGTVLRELGIIGGVAAEVPDARVDSLRQLPGVERVTPNGRITLSHAVDGFDATTDFGSMFTTSRILKTEFFYSGGYTGKGIDVALIDSGVAPVNGLTASGKVINGPDISFESQMADRRYIDTFGHGTHMAGLIAGRDDGFTYRGKWWDKHDDFVGVAPDARIVNVKVANEQGAADVSQIIAAIDWVVQHRNSNGLNIRVLNLSFGTDGSQDYILDPLSYAVEVAWRRGIVVVVAAGNNGKASGQLSNPAFNPRILAVGANDHKQSYPTKDDVVPSWSSRGDGVRNPDIVAPGVSLAGLRAPGSFVDRHHPEGRINSRLFRGSGTSQASALTAGAVALLLEQRPDLSPDQVKAMLRSTATPLPAANLIAQGRGMLDMKSLYSAPTPLAATVTQPFPLATGLGTLDGARGSSRVVHNGVELSGEQDIFGAAWDGSSWTRSSWSGSSWSGGTWNGSSWSGSSWSGSSWSGSSWSGSSWSRSSWSGSSWSGSSWSGASWSGSSWSGSSWSGSSWSGASWT